MEWHNQPAPIFYGPRLARWAMAMVILAVVSFGTGWAIGSISGAL